MMVKWSNMVIKVDAADKFHGQIDKSYLFLGISQQNHAENELLLSHFAHIFWQISESSTLKSHVCHNIFPTSKRLRQSFKNSSLVMKKCTACNRGR